MSKLVVVGGSKGLGLSIVIKLQKHFSKIVVYDVSKPLIELENVHFIKCNLLFDVAICEREICDADALIITAGFGAVKYFKDMSLTEVYNTMIVNSVSAVQLIRMFFHQLISSTNKYCMVLSSIAGEVASPLFATYGAAKSSITKISESLNAELKMLGSLNRITCVSATAFKGTSFNGEKTDIKMLDSISTECINAMFGKEEIHHIEKEIYDSVVARYLSDPTNFAIESFNYKIKNNRISNRKMVKVGYLSGTFDLFHIGHLNLLRRAKEYCDYLIVSVHESGAWKGKETFIPYNERCEIVSSVRYVDQVAEDFKDDSDAWEKYKYDYLFVGSDYKGTERFKRYEEFFKDKGVTIVYFPYTKGTSSTQLREKLSKK